MIFNRQVRRGLTEALPCELGLEGGEGGSHGKITGKAFWAEEVKRPWGRTVTVLFLAVSPALEQPLTHKL